MIEVCTVGGYSEVGKNMTAIKVDDEVVILDMGVFMDKYILFNKEFEEGKFISPNELIKEGALPDIHFIEDWRKKVKAIACSHAHMDHVAAISFLADRFKAPVICTAYTAEVIKSLAADQKVRIANRIKVLNVNSSIKVSDKIKIEFINMTHSIPQAVSIAVHTPYGVIVYTNDFKLDRTPVLGKPPNYERLRELGEQGKVLALFLDSIYSSEHIKTPSEAVAKEMLREVMLGTESHGKLMIVTTFSSHLARIKSIIEFGKILKRKIVFIGRSLDKYIRAGENVKIVNFSKSGEIVRFTSQAKRKLKQVEKDRHKYLLIVTGHQGEPGSALDKMTSEFFDFKFQREDLVIFSCKVIPTETNRHNREMLEKVLKSKGVRIFTDIHVSGHGAREDERDMIKMLKPKYIIPAHAPESMIQGAVELAKEMGYDRKHIITSHDGNRFKLG
ncbi:RNase J family beta-CASP ribonuclease [Candidatus Woesearchaeota archaeon]|nr:RNase J family beta-CASP ribonuclease [Candidatus Woesearchaeota archaeon]